MAGAATGTPGLASADIGAVPAISGWGPAANAASEGGVAPPQTAAVPDVTAQVGADRDRGAAALMLATACLSREVPAGVTPVNGAALAWTPGDSEVPRNGAEAIPPPRTATIRMATTAVRNRARDIR
jgi:hypothetical protein